MKKLKALPPRVSALPSRFASEPQDERGRDRKRRSDQHWRGWYGLKRWQDLKAAAFVRDGYVCQRSGVLCIGKHPEPNSPVANHKRAHRGDAALFWDIDNIETVSKAVHDSLIQQEEQAVPMGRWD